MAGELPAESLASCPWGDYAPATVHFCERRLCAWVVEPSNGWSNLAFIVAGLVVLWLQRKELKTVLTTVGVSSLLVGIGSFGLHGTGTLVGEILDVSAMYLISGLFIAFNIKRLWNWPDGKILAFYVALCAVSIAQLIALHYNGIVMFALQVTVAGLMEIRLFRKKRGATRYLYLNLLCGFFVAAFTVWALDITGTVCDPDNHVFTGHAFWHTANAFCLVFFYLYHQQFVTRPSQPQLPRRP